jgi:hypothetical protein
MMGDQHNTVLLPRIEGRIQVMRGLRVMMNEKAKVVANCDDLQNFEFYQQVKSRE